MSNEGIIIFYWEIKLIKVACGMYLSCIYAVSFNTQYT